MDESRTKGYYQNITLPENVTSEYFLVLAVESVKRLQWDFGYVSEAGLTAYTPASSDSVGEVFKIKIDGQFANISSEASQAEGIEEYNRRNVEEFKLTYDELRENITQEELQKEWEKLKSNSFSVEKIRFTELPDVKSKISNVFSIFIPTEGYYVTPILININILFFMLMVFTGVNVFEPTGESLVWWGANYRPYTLEGGWWRLLTACFIHIGIIHLLMNMYALLYIGVLLEPILGRVKFLSAYILTGVAASATSLLWHDNVISAGASGAIFGMYGIFLAMLTTNLIEKSARKALLSSIGIFVGYNLIFGLKGGIDNAAHLGGLISGFIVGYIIYFSLKGANNLISKYSIGTSSILVLTFSSFVFFYIPGDMGEYDERFKEFTAMEAMALEVYLLPENTPKEKVLAEIRDRGLYYWNENIKLLEEMDKLDIPEALHTQNELFSDYCNLRIQSYLCMYKSIEEDSDLYRDSLAYYDQKIEALFEEFKGKQESN